MPDTPGWVLAARFITTGEAEAAASALDAAGIDCQLADENLVGIDWGVSQAVGGVKILVREGDLESAQEILFTPAVDQVIEPVADAREPEPAAVCPVCGSAEFVRLPRIRIFLLIAVIFLGVGVAVGEPLFAATGLIAVALGAMLMPSARCVRCGHRWTPPPPRREEAPLPQAVDTIEERCPRCGSFEVYRINDRRMKALPLLFSPAIFAVIPFWLLSPSRRCDACGLTLR